MVKPPTTLLCLPSIAIHLLLSTSSSQALSMKYSYQPSTKSYNGMTITSLNRYAIKGLSGDALPTVTLSGEDGTFEDDRRFALLYESSLDRFSGDDPGWLHKENFLCAFTAPELLATLDTEYRVETSHNDDDTSTTKRLLSIWKRNKLGRSSAPLLGPVDLACPLGREETSDFFTELCGRKVHCVVANDVKKATATNTHHSRLAGKHTHQFGNTSSGVKNNNGDTRTIHIINENTVKEFSNAICEAGDVAMDSSTSLSCTRFRPNIIIKDLDPWAEFDLIGKTIEVVPKTIIEGDEQETPPPLRFRITSRTVRCAGVGVDPLHPELGVIDVPNLLAAHFPEHGPYLGVYAVVENCGDGCGGVISIGDTFRVL